MRRLLLSLLLVAAPAFAQTKFSLQNQATPAPNGAAGDTWHATSATQISRLGIGTDNYCFTVSPSTHLPVWATCAHGSGATGLIAFWTAADTLGSNATFTFDTGTNTFSLHGVESAVNLTATGQVIAATAGALANFTASNGVAALAGKSGWTVTATDAGGLEIGGGDSAATKATISTTGNLGIGTASPASKVSIMTAGSATPGTNVSLGFTYSAAAGLDTVAFRASPAAAANLYLDAYRSSNWYVLQSWDRLNNRVGISTLAAGTAFGPVSLFHVASDTTALGVTTLSQASADADSHDLVIQKSRGTTAAPTVITTGDELGTIQFKGSDAAGTYAAGAYIKAISAQTIASTRIPTNLSIWTGPDTAPSTPAERLTVLYNGNVGISQGAPPALLSVGGATTALNGQIQWSTGASAIPLSVPGVMFVATADATTTANNASSLFGTGVGTLTIPINGLVVGRTIRIRMGGYVSTADTGAGTKTLVFTLGGVTVATGTSKATFQTVINTEWMAEAEFTCRTTGGTGTVFGGARWMTQVASASAMTGVFATGTAVAVVNTTGTLAIDLTFNNGVATGAIKTTWATVEVLN